MPWGYKLEGKDGARGFEGGPTAMLTGSRGTAIAGIKQGHWKALKPCKEWKSRENQGAKDLTRVHGRIG